MIGTEVLWQRPLADNGAMEHPTESDAIDRSGMHPKADDPARILIHYDEDPVSPQDCRLAAKEIDTPEAVLGVPDESQPGGPAGMRHGSVIGGQDTPDHVFIYGNAKSLGNLLSDTRAAPGWNASFCVDHGIDEFFGGSLWARLTAALRRKPYVILSVPEGTMEFQ
jgi:hypothetical protein